MVLTPRFEDSLGFIARLHGGDVRKGTRRPSTNSAVDNS